MPAPSIDSDNAKQFASFSQKTSLLNAFLKSFWKGFFSIQIQLGAFFTNPVWGEWTPGWHTPTGKDLLNSFSKLKTISYIDWIIKL